MSDTWYSKTAKGVIAGKIADSKVKAADNFFQPTFV